MYKKRFDGRKNSRFSISFFSNKSGQITIFIILGILLLLALALIIALSKEAIVFKPEQILPTDKGKIESFITNCIEQSGEEALFRVGLSGGYVDMPAELANNAGSSLKVSPANSVLYWAYREETYIPSLQEIKVRIDQHLEENVRSCLIGSEAFQERYDLIEKSEITANTEIVESKVLFNVHWNVEVKDKSGEVITELINHVAESDIKLKNVYDTAVMITQEEMSTLKLEDITQDLIALEHPDLPLAGMELSCSQKTWKVDKAEETFQELIRRNVKRLNIKGTNILEYPEEFTYLQNHYSWDMGDEFNYPNVNVVFNYDPNYPLLFQVTPTNGNTLKSSSLGGIDQISFLCLQNWKFTYDTVYPVLIRVQDETTGYNFNFVLSVHLVRNIPDRASQTFARETTKLNLIDDDKYCSSRRIPMNVITSEQVDNDFDVYDSEPLDDVQISFTCLKYKCDLGESKFNFANRGYQSGLLTNFPYCVGGILRGEKDGYKETWERVVTEAGKDVELNLAPLLEFPTNKISIVKHKFVGPEEELGPAEELSEEEMALIRLTNYRKQQKFHEQQQVISNLIDPELVQESKFQFLAQADFPYVLEINVFAEDQMTAAYKQNITIPWNQLENANEIVFHILEPADSSQESMFELITKLEEYSAYIPEPEFK